MIEEDIEDYKNEILSCRHRLLKVKDDTRLKEVLLDRINYFTKLLEDINNV